MKAENLAVRFSAFFSCPKKSGDSDRRGELPAACSREAGASAFI